MYNKNQHCSNGMNTNLIIELNQARITNTIQSIS